LIHGIWKRAFFCTGMAFLLAHLPSQADAQTVILKCGVFTFDIDVGQATVMWAGGGKSRETVRAVISDRLIEFPNPWSPELFQHRIDRRTLDFYNWSSKSGWGPPTTCLRVKREEGI
jgi:hypothetical protein